MKRFAALVVFSLFVCLMSVNASADLITGVEATASSSWYTMPVSRIVDGSGLNTSNDPPTHSSTDWDTFWETMYYQSSAWVVFDLKNASDVGSFRVWNFNGVNPNGSYAGRGAKDVDISTSSDGNIYQSRGSYVFDCAPGLDTYTGQLFPTQDWDGVRYVKFDIRSIWGWGDTGGHFGLSEVQFYTAEAAPVPVPAAAWLLGSGLAGLAAVRRRFKK